MSSTFDRVVFTNAQKERLIDLNSIKEEIAFCIERRNLVREAMQNHELPSKNEEGKTLTAESYYLLAQIKKYWEIRMKACFPLLALHLGGYNNTDKWLRDNNFVDIDNIAYIV